MTDTYGQRLATLDPETGKRPTSRIGNAGNARSLVQRLKHEDDERMYRYTTIQGLMDGNPPWNSQKLIDIGQGHRANFNLRESEGIVEAAKTPYYDLVFEVPSFAQIEFDTAGQESWMVDQWNGWITEEYTDVLSAWDGFDIQMQLHQWQMIVNGTGPLFWPHYLGWHSEATKARKVLVPIETKANVDELEMCVVLHSYRADELDSFLDKGATDDPAGEGWNRPLCKQAIIDCSMREMRTTWGMENYDLYQRAIRTGDLFYGIHRSDRIYVASIFVKEFGGKISHYIITDSPINQDQPYDSLAEETGYIFKRRNKYDSFAQVLCPFFFDTGPDGTWHSVKGLGPKIYDYCDISNRTFCQMLDGAVIGSGITLETQDSNSLEETQISLVGGASVVAPGYKVAQTRIAEALEGALAIRRELHGTLQQNTGSYRQRSDESRPEPTLGQAQIISQQQGTLTKGATNRYYNNLDKWHRETLRRLLDPAQNETIPGGLEAMKFKARCIIRGIPAQILDFRNIKRVVSTRSIGYGSPQLRDVATTQLVQLIPYMNEVGRNHALRARVASLPGVGMYSVDSYFQPIEKSGVPDAHAALAVLENNALRTQGGRALVEPQQNHSIHFDVHMQDVMQHVAPQMAQMMQQQGQGGGQGGPPPSGAMGGVGAMGGPPIQTLPAGQLPLPPPSGQTPIGYAQGGVVAGNGSNGSNGAGPMDPADMTSKLIHMEQAGPHMAQHLAALQGDPTRQMEVKQKQKQLDMVGKISDQLHQQLTEHLGAMAQQPPPGEPQPPDPAMVKVMGDLQLKGQKQQHEFGLKERKAAHSESLSDKKTGTGIQRETLKAQTQIQREDAKAKTAIAREGAKTRTSIQRETAKTATAIRNQNALAAAAARRKQEGEQSSQ
jgi:hypothetical protein